MKGVFDIYDLPVGKSISKGEARISAYEFKTENDPLFNLRSYRDDGGLTAMEDGKYVRLVVGNELMMSDTQMEKRTNQEFCEKANGMVLVAGLGLGLIINNVKEKFESGVIVEMAVIEKSKDVIDLVRPYFNHLPINFIHADIFNWVPKDNHYQKFDVIYFDIWSQISEDNLPEIRKLHNKFKFHLNRQNPNCWMDSWMKWFLQQQRQKERRNPYGW